MQKSQRRRTKDGRTDDDDGRRRGTETPKRHAGERPQAEGVVCKRDPIDATEKETRQQTEDKHGEHDAKKGVYRRQHTKRRN